LFVASNQAISSSASRLAVVDDEATVVEAVGEPADEQVVERAWCEPVDASVAVMRAGQTEGQRPPSTVPAPQQRHADRRLADQADTGDHAPGVEEPHAPDRRSWAVPAGTRGCNRSADHAVNDREGR
jgi:hypothetical protein